MEKIELLTKQLKEANEINIKLKLEIKLEREKVLIEQFPNNIQCIYYGKIDNKSENNEDLIKFGCTNNLNSRIKNHKKTYNNFILLNAFRVPNKLLSENLIKKHNILATKLRKICINENNSKSTELITYNKDFTLDKINKIMLNIVQDSYKDINKEIDMKTIDLNILKEKNKQIEPYKPLNNFHVMLNYPIDIINFKNTKQQTLFRYILEHHNYKDIVEYFKLCNKEYKYRYYTDNTIYDSDNELVSESQLYYVFHIFWKNELNKMIEFFYKNNEYPKIDDKCYNQHIIFNMNILKDILNDKRDKIMINLLETYNTNELSYNSYSNNNFIEKIHYIDDKKSIIKFNDIHEIYKEWRSIKKSTNIELTKLQLRDKIIEHLNTKYPDKTKQLKYERHRDPNNKGKENRFYGWLYIYYDNNF